MSELASLIEQSRSYLVILGPEASFDHWVSATSWYLGLQAKNKQVRLVVPTLPKPEKVEALALKQVYGYSEVKTDLNSQNAVVSFAYSDQSVDSVSYILDEVGKRFTLTIKPKPGFAPLDIKTVQTSYAGSDAEIIVLVGIHNLEALGKLYSENKSVFDNARLITVHSFKPEIATIALTSDGFTSMAEATTQTLQDLEVAFTPELASNLLFGIEKQTDWLSSLRTTAKTFELVAYLLQAGAKRQPRPKIGVATTHQVESGTKKPNSKSIKVLPHKAG